MEAPTANQHTTQLVDGPWSRKERKFEYKRKSEKGFAFRFRHDDVQMVPTYNTLWWCSL